ncbi:TPA: ead/Ea22-like family protein [Klebsiella aerogenes]|nr:ead/Ea22-like family protein [Klebsiella aerogenes]
MTDITELAQSLKAAAEKATPGEWCSDDQYGIVADAGLNGNYYIASCSGPEHRQNKRFIALANPANVLALVQALEKAQAAERRWHRVASRIHEQACESDVKIDELEAIRAAAEKLVRCKGRYHSEQNYRALAALFGVNTPDLPPLDSESRPMKLPPELYTIGELIRTQDNRITDQPMFVVFQKREIIGSDEHSPSRICWVWDGEEVSELRAKRLEALYQDGRDTRGYDRYAMQEVDEFVTACFTEHGCKEYLRQNGHNLRLPYIYACGSFRNNEYQLVRNWLAGINVEAE